MVPIGPLHFTAGAKTRQRPRCGRTFGRAESQARSVGRWFAPKTWEVGWCFVGEHSIHTDPYDYNLY